MVWIEATMARPSLALGTAFSLSGGRAGRALAVWLAWRLAQCDGEGDGYEVLMPIPYSLAIPAPLNGQAFIY